MLPTITKRSFRPFFMPNFFDDDFLPMLSDRASSMPSVNIREDDRNYILDLAVPGIDKNDLKIDINEDVLTVALPKQEEEKNKITRQIAIS